MLAIKNMQMPKCCSECNFKYYDDGEDVLCCALEDGYISDEEADEKRLECCPLVEIGPHKPMVEIDLYSVIKQKYIEREVLDKIRAEIDEVNEKLDGYDPHSLDSFAERIDFILDKYKKEGEQK